MREIGRIRNLIEPPKHFNKYSVAHIALGGLAGWLSTENLSGIAVIIGLIAYQALEEVRKKDWSFRDVKEILYGLIPISVFFTIWKGL